MLTSYILRAAAIVIAVAARDFTFGSSRCEVCGEKDEHLVGCPGRRGY